MSETAAGQLDKFGQGAWQNDAWTNEEDPVQPVEGSPSSTVSMIESASSVRPLGNVFVRFRPVRHETTSSITMPASSKGR